MAGIITERSILIVDDSPIITERLYSMLKSVEGIGVIRSADNYASALQLLADPLPAIVLLDINIPGGSGIDLLRYIKNRFSWISVIMVTNQSGEYYRIVCKKLGADHFIDKSKDFEQVPIVVSSFF